MIRIGYPKLFTLVGKILPKGKCPHKNENEKDNNFSHEHWLALWKIKENLLMYKHLDL
jgi:hypothetical protein